MLVLSGDECEPSLELNWTRYEAPLPKMKIAIVGANGRLGAALVREYQRDYEVTSYDRRQLDLGQLDRFVRLLQGPSLIYSSIAPR